MIQVKTCPTCETMKPVFDFLENKRSKDGLQSKCESCTVLHRARQARYRKTRKGRLAKNRDNNKNSKNWKVSQDSRRKLRIQLLYKSPYPILLSIIKICERAHRQYSGYKVELHPDSIKRRAEDKRRAEGKARAGRWKRRYHNDPVFKAKEQDRLRNKKARRRGAKGSFTSQEFYDLCNEYGNRCLRCNAQGPLTRDHVVPLSKGGTNYLSNIQPLCSTCNISKGAKHIDYRYVTLPSYDAMSHMSANQ